MARFWVAAEGSLDIAIARRVCSAAGHGVAAEYEGGGKAKVDAKLGAYNAAAARVPWFVLRDLDHDSECAGELIEGKLPSPALLMCFRVAVRQAEAWLLADREELARYLGISAVLVPLDPEAERNPKQVVVNLARRSRRRQIKEMVPRTGSGAQVGPDYTRALREFVDSRWDPPRAARSAPSLRRCLAALASIGARSRGM